MVKQRSRKNAKALMTTINVDDSKMNQHILAVQTGKHSDAGKEINHSLNHLETAIKAINRNAQKNHLKRKTNDFLTAIVDMAEAFLTAIIMESKSTEEA